MPPREAGEGGTAYAQRGSILSPSAQAAVRGRIKVFPGSQNFPGKSAKMLTHFTPATKATVWMKKSLWVQSHLMCSAAGPQSLHILALKRNYFCLKTPWTSVNG